MLKHIHIQNYALIESLNVDFKEGYSAITGETGAGKSILLGALSLILGNRADTNILKDKSKKCVVEAHFDIQRYSLKLFYDEYDIDYDEITVIRREISPNGRSRAFINDTPVNLNVIKDLSLQLTDIHSQHQNLNLNNHIFQLNVLDAFSKLDLDLSEYKEKFTAYNKLKKKYNNLKKVAEKEKSEIEYLQFRFDELEGAKLNVDEQENAEIELEELNHAEEIKHSLSVVFETITNDDSGVASRLRDSISQLRGLNKYFKKSDDYIQRLESVKIEIDDLSSELEVISEDIEFNPERAEYLKERLDLIYSLQSKHKVSSIEELNSVKEDIENRLSEITSYDIRLIDIQNELAELKHELKTQAEKISEIRKSNAPVLEYKITDILKKLAMPNAKFVISQTVNNEFTEQGIDDISFLFSANKNISPQEISEIASGGEISRLMLSIKSVISDTMALPAIIFDEIDTGVSGDVAEKIGIIMKEMSENIQVLNITHLPQVAAKADHHYKVYKVDDELSTITNIKKLNNEERINELASMLSGENITDAAILNAKVLLKN